MRRALAVGEDLGRALLVQLWDTPQEHTDKGLALQGGGWGKTRVRRKVDLMMRTLSAPWTWIFPADSGGPPQFFVPIPSVFIRIG